MIINNMLKFSLPALFRLQPSS